MKRKSKKKKETWSNREILFWILFWAIAGAMFYLLVDYLKTGRPARI